MLAQLEHARGRLDARFPSGVGELAVVLHGTAAQLAAAQPWLTLQRALTDAGGRRYLVGWTADHELHVLAPRLLAHRASNVEGSLEMLMLAPSALLARRYIGANHPGLPPPFGPRRFARYLRWAWLVEGAAQWFSGQARHVRPAVARRLHEGSAPRFRRRAATRAARRHGVRPARARGGRGRVRAARLRPAPARRRPGARRRVRRDGRCATRRPPGAPTWRGSPEPGEPPPRRAPRLRVAGDGPSAAPRRCALLWRGWIGPDAERAQPVHLTEREGDEVAELDELGLAEMGVELGPQRVVGPPVVPRDGLGPVQRGALAAASRPRRPRWRGSARTAASASWSTAPPSRTVARVSA